MRLRSSTLSFFNLRNVIPIRTERIVCLVICQAVFPCGLLIRGDLNENALCPLITQQIQIVRKHLRKGAFNCSSN